MCLLDISFSHEFLKIKPKFDGMTRQGHPRSTTMDQARFTSRIFHPRISVLHFSVLHFLSLQSGAAFSSPAISVPAFLTVLHFPVSHFCRPEELSLLS